MAKRQQKKRGYMGCLGRTLFISLILFALLVGGGVLLASALISSNLTTELEEGIAALENARDRETFETTRITDRNGVTLWEIFGEGKRTQVSLDRIPDTLKYATIAIEDDTFYTNKGFDEPSLIAAVIANMRNTGGRPIGGSTITQQIVRHIAFDYEERVSVSYRRKLKELFLAWRMTQDFTKDEILEMYLNEIYYGNLAYGAEAAAQTYFGKSVSDLSLAESSLMAGLPQAPVQLDPFTNLEAAKARQWFILTLMIEDGGITLDQANAAYLEDLTFAVQSVSLNAPHFSIYVRQQLESLFDADMVANGGLNVTTTLDMRYQRLAEQLSTQHVAALRENNMTNAALIAMKPNTGEILAMLGSVDYKDDSINGQVNIATSLQQPGSTFKPLTYALAMSPERMGERAWQPASVIWDVPIQYQQVNGELYEPVNYDGQFHGPMRLRESLANSYNLTAVQLAQDVGVAELLDFSRQMGLESLSEDLSLYGLSLTLGGGEVRPIEMATAYSVFANGGSKVPPVTILRVTNSRGDVLYQHEEPSAERILSPETAFLISDMLDDEVARQPAMGVDNPLALPFPAAAKTGTTNDFRDNWTVGYTPGLVTVVWTGNTDNSPMIDVSGLSGAAPLWADYMQAVYADQTLIPELEVTEGLLPPTEFTPPTTLERTQFCDLKSVQANTENCELSIGEWRYKDGSLWITPEPSVRFEQLEEGVVRALSAPLANAPIPFCLMDEGKWPPQTAMRMFIAPPRDPNVIEPAQTWAQQAGMLILPNAICDTGVAVANPPTAAAGATAVPAATAIAGATAPPVVWNTPTPNWAATQQAQQAAQPTWTPRPPKPTATPLPPPPTVAAQPPAFQPPTTGLFYQISSPSVGETVQGVVPIMGSAVFDSNTVQFYKVELKRDGREWITLGQSHSAAVTNGQLETLNAPGIVDLFGEGGYQLRLILIRPDGNYAGEPFMIPITIRR